MEHVVTVLWKSKQHAKATWVRVKGSERVSHLIVGSVYVHLVSETGNPAEVAADFEMLAKDIEHQSQTSKVLNVWWPCYWRLWQ